jgi:hypothetical protein
MQNKIIIISGIGASGSSGVFEYFKQFEGMYAVEPELKPIIKDKLYAEWVRSGFRNSDVFSEKILNALKPYLIECDSTHTILLNNVISGITLRGFELFSNAKLLCVVRDPRSTWVAWQNEWVDKSGCRKFSTVSDPVGRFIQSYRNIRSVLDYNLKVMSNNRQNIQIINFEDFALYPVCRFLQRRFLNIESDLDPVQVLRDFDKTIFAHKYYPVYSDILRIECELKEFCYDGV